MILWWSSKLFTLQCQRTCGNHTVDISRKGWLPLRPKRQRNSGAVCSPVWFASHHSSPSSQRRKHFCLAPLWKNRTPHSAATYNRRVAHLGAKVRDFTQPWNQIGGLSETDSILSSSQWDEWLDHSWRVNAVLSIWRIFSMHCHTELTLRGSWYLLGNRKHKTLNQCLFKLFGRWRNHSHV